MAAELSVRELSHLIGDIYDCAIDPARWEPTLEKIRDLLDCRHAFLHLDDLRTRRSVIAKSVGIEPAWLQRQSAMLPEVTGILMRVLDSGHSIDEPSVASRHMTPAELSRSPYAQDWGRPQGLVDYMDFFLVQTPTRLASLGFARHESRGVITDTEIETGRLLIPHLRRAVTVSNVLDAQHIEADRFSETLDILKVAVILTNELGRIIYANAAADEMLQSNGLLRNVGGLLQAKSARAGAEISAAITMAANNDPMIGKIGLAVRLSDENTSAVIAHILPLSKSKGAPNLPNAAAAVFVNKSLDETAISQAVASAYGLTQAETRVLEEVLSGKTITEAAGQLGVTGPTARTHLSHIFAKTGVSRQSALIRLAAGIAPAARRP